MVAPVLVYLGEGFSVLAVLFSAHPTADTSNKTGKTGDNFVTLIASNRRVDYRVHKYPAVIPASSMGFCTHGNTKLVSHLIRTKKQEFAFRSIESNGNLTCLGVLCPVDFPQRLRRVPPQFHHTTSLRPALSEPSHEVLQNL